MKSSEARFLMEKYLQEFFTVFPGDIPRDLHSEQSPIFAMGMGGGLSIESAARYVYWLIHTHRITDLQGGGLLAIVGDTARVVHQIPYTEETTWQALGIDWKKIEQSVHAVSQTL